MQIRKDKTPNAEISLAEFAGCSGELELNARRTSDPFQLQFSTGDGVSRLQIQYDPSHPTQITMDGEPLLLDSDGRDEFRLHAFADSSVIELLLNDRHALTKRFYYTGSTAQKLRITWQGNAANLVSSFSWDLSPISDDRLTG